MDSFILNFELFFRVKDYIKNGLDSKYLRDPDGQLCMLRKKARLGVLESAEPELPQSFPKEGFSDDLMKIPKLTFGTVWKYMIEGVSAKKKIATGKPLVKGYNFFKSGHVLKVLAGFLFFLAFASSALCGDDKDFCTPAKKLRKEPLFVANPEKH